MNRLEEFLQNLDLKNKIMLYLSIVVVGVIIYYNFNYNILNSQIEDNNKQLKKLEKRVNFSFKNYKKKLIKLKKEYKNLKIIKNEKIQDLDYLNKRIDLSPLKLDDKKFYSILESILYNSSSLNLTPDFYIDKKFDKFKKYVIDINGTLAYCQEKNLFNFIKFLKSGKYVVNIDNFRFDVNSSNYFIRYNIWGLK
jgi:hypothetical protein